MNLFEKGITDLIKKYIYEFELGKEYEAKHYKKPTFFIKKAFRRINQLFFTMIKFVFVEKVINFVFCSH